MKKPLQLLQFLLLQSVQLRCWEWYVSLGQVPKIAGIWLHSADADAMVTHCVPRLMFSAVPGWILNAAPIKDTHSSFSCFLGSHSNILLKEKNGVHLGECFCVRKRRQENNN